MAQMTALELGQRTKAKYPSYQNIPDEELGRKIATKYPQYQLIESSPTQKVDELISEREIKPFQAEIPQSPKNLLEVITKSKALPFSIPFMSGSPSVGSSSIEDLQRMGQNVGALKQREESAVAGGLRQAIKKPTDIFSIGKEFGKGIVGKKATELGDIPREAGIPEPVSATLGLAGSFALPTNLMEGAVSIPPAVKSLQRTPQQLLKKAGGIAEKRTKLVTEILKPPKSELQNAISKSFDLDSLEESGKVIQKSKNFKHLGENLKKEIKGRGDKVKSLIEKTNEIIKDREHLEPLIQEIDRIKESGIATDESIEQMEKVLQKEKNFLDKHPAFDKLSAQQRKLDLQKETLNLIERREGGDSVVTQPFRKQALDLVRYGIRKRISKGQPEIEKLNKELGGLIEGNYLVSGQRADVQKAKSPNAIQKLLLKIPGVRSLAQATPFVKEMLPKGIVKEDIMLGIPTKKISKLRGKESRLRNIAERRSETKIKNKPDEEHAISEEQLNTLKAIAARLNKRRKVTA